MMLSATVNFKGLFVARMFNRLIGTVFACGTLLDLEMWCAHRWSVYSLWILIFSPYFFEPCFLISILQISIGDARSYFLSTARNDLGVIFANSVSGSEMTPLSWNEMRDANGVVENRKVAGPEAPK